MDTREGRLWAGIDWEFGINVYLLDLKWIKRHLKRYMTLTSFLIDIFI